MTKFEKKLLYVGIIGAIALTAAIIGGGIYAKWKWKKDIQNYTNQRQ